MVPERGTSWLGAPSSPWTSLAGARGASRDGVRSEGAGQEEANLKVQVSGRKSRQSSRQKPKSSQSFRSQSGRSLKPPQDCLVSAGLHPGWGWGAGVGHPSSVGTHRWGSESWEPGFWSWPALASPGGSELVIRYVMAPWPHDTWSQWYLGNLWLSHARFHFQGWDHCFRGLHVPLPTWEASLMDAN